MCHAGIEIRGQSTHDQEGIATCRRSELCSEHRRITAVQDDLRRGFRTHRQALAQCHRWLSHHLPDVERRPVASNAEGARLAAQGCGNARVETADALAWDNDQHFDAICVSGAVHALPPRFVEWLKPGGRMFVVQGRSPAMQATLVHRDVNGLRTESLFETDLPYLAGAAPQPEFTL